jgi:membrane fusion protein
MFRPEATKHAGARSYGSVILARPTSHLVLTGLFAAIAASLITFLALFSATRKAQVPGILLPTQGLVRVQPSQAGVVTERRAREGDSVKEGDILFVLTSERATVTRGQAETAITALIQSRRDSLAIEQGQQRLQSLQRIEAARRRAADLALESQRIDEQVALQDRRVALAEGALQRHTELHAANFISAAGVQDKQAEVLDQRQRLADLRRVRAVNARELAGAEAEVRDLQVQAQRDRQTVERNLASIDQDLTENEARRQVLVRAPQDGTITAITAEPGQTAASGQALATILPAGSELEAELYAPSRSAGFVKPGMDVLLRYQAYPYQKFGQFHGQVREVSSTAMQPSEFALGGLVSAGPGQEPLYRIRVKLDRQSVTAYGADKPLKSGMALDASVLLDKRRLYEWVLEPLYSISGRV